MARRTAKTAQEAIDWINTTPHHRGRWEPLMGKPEDRAVFVLGNYKDELRIPVAVLDQCDLKANGWPHERMYSASLKPTT